jgi:alkylation response protein AidB-like acyl-CoA dehydrogenase
MSIDDHAVGEDLHRRVRALIDEHDPVLSDPRDFLAARFDAGLAWLHFPRGSGGLDMPRGFQAQVEAQLIAAGAPPAGRGRNGIGMAMAAPTIVAFGTVEQQQKFLRPLFIGDHIYCQLFSEPGAGSDLAGLPPAQSATVTTGLSTGRRYGRPAHRTHRWRSWSRAPTRRCPNIEA